MSGWDDPVSVVEDLDPEPDQPPGRFLLRDLVLGLVLLVGVLSFAGWQWWSQESRQSNYTRAVDALTHNDLDQARSLFAGASGYRDADTRVADLDQRIARRDSLYFSTTTLLSEGDWTAALAGLRDLRAMQPGYRDTAALERTAVTHLGRQTLNGSVAVRDAPGSPPGLYYRKDTGWVYLPGSDLNSRVRGSGAAGLLVYDAPEVGSIAGARRMMLGNLLGAAPASVPLPFDPEIYQEFRWNENGLWAFRHGRYSTPGQAPVVNAMHGVEAAYLPYGGDATYTVSFENTGGAMGEVLVDVDGTGDRYLMASWTGAAPWSSAVLSSTIISLSVGSAGGGNHMVYATRGVGVDSARLSRDGKYALVTTFTPSPNGGQIYRLLLLDLQRGGEPQQLDGVRTRPYGGNEAPTRWIASTFIESGAYAGKVLAAVFNFDHTHLRIYDPELPEEPILDADVPTTTGIAWAVPRADERGLVLSGAEFSFSPPYGPNETQTIPVVEISPRGQVTGTGVIVEKHRGPYSVDLAPDHLAVVSVRNEEDMYIWTVYSAPATNLGQASVRPTVIYTQYVPGSVGLTGPSPVNVDRGLLTYIEHGNLRVRTYDGVVDEPLEEGIVALYPRSFLHDRYPVLR